MQPAVEGYIVGCAKGPAGSCMAGSCGMAQAKCQGTV